VEEGQNGIGKIYFACTNELIFLHDVFKKEKNSIELKIMGTIFKFS